MPKTNLTDMQKRKLKKEYIMWYLVTKEIKIRIANCIESKQLNVLCGIDKLGARQVLGIYMEKEKDNRFWLEIFEDLRGRNAERVMFLVTPKDHNVERCAKMVYNGIKIVECPESITESISRYFPDKPSRALKISFKNLFLVENKEALEVELQLFKDRYINNKLILKLLENKEENIRRFYEYTYEVRRLLYPYYAIRDMKSYINKISNLEEMLSNITEISEYCMPYVNSYEKGRSQTKEEWLKIVNALYEAYPNEMEVYM